MNFKSSRLENNRALRHLRGRLLRDVHSLASDS
jgi:hypothetical protein